MPSEIDRRIFVVGVPRSGTTLVQSLLAAHSSLTSFTESHFFDQHFTLLPLTSSAILTRNPVPRLREFLAENEDRPPGAAGWFETGGRSVLPVRALLPFRTRRVAEQLLRVLDELALGRGKSSWVEKTPRHLRYLPFLESLAGPESRMSFVHVIRDGLEVTASLHTASQRWERPYGLNTCVRRWNRDVRFSLDRIGSANDHFVFYEALTARPEQTLRQLLDGLGLDWEPEILDRFPHASDRLITQQEAWKEGVGRTIRPSGTAARVLTEKQRDRVNRSLHRGLYDQLFERTGAT